VTAYLSYACYSTYPPYLYAPLAERVFIEPSVTFFRRFLELPDFFAFLRDAMNPPVLWGITCEPGSRSFGQNYTWRALLSTRFPPRLTIS
jgi:hypothetical protein